MVYEHFSGGQEGGESMNTSIRVKLASGFASMALLAAVAAPAAFASTDVTISGNGAFSNNAANVSNSSTSTVTQTSSTNVTNTTNISQNTGNNSSSFNTGGSSQIVTGDANATVINTVTGGSNFASLGNCGCNTNTSVRISRNGAFSDNHVNVRNNQSSTVNQSTATNVTNYTNLSQNTGYNNNSFNTGKWGFNSIRTGNANAYVSNMTHGGSNVLF